MPALKAGVQSIMASHNMWNGLRLHGSKYLLTDVLKTRLGFDGFIVGDWNSHSKIPGCSNDSCPQAVNAGLDMFMVVEDWKAFIGNTVEQVKDGIIPVERIDDAVRRILRVKIRSGLFDKGLPSTRKYANQKQLLGAPEHKAIARQAVRESLVLLKNNNNLLPLNPNSKVLIAGDGAENMSKQTGGWTINWTGEGNVKSDFPGGTSIFDGIKQAVNKAGGKAVLSPDGSFDEKPDVAIVVFGENPYAEWIGDLKSIAYQAHSHRDAKLIESLKSQGIKVVSVFLSGRPLWVNREINASDSFVAAWLPGSEGVGVADVLFKDNEGNIQFDFKGKLSFSWPKYASQVVLNRYDENYDPLFAYGFGLTYKDNVMLNKLSTKNDFIFETPVNTPYQIMQGRAKGDWNYQLQSGGQTKDIHTPSGNIKGLTMIEADKNIQGDAKEFTWSGANNASVLISSSWYREDLSQYLINKSALTFDVRVETPPRNELYVQMGCAKGKCAELNISPMLKEFKLNTWNTVSIDLLCFAKSGVEFERSSAPFVLTSEGAAKIRIANVQFEPNAQKMATLKCSE